MIYSINNKKGETIVEVLIAIAVLGMALGGAFSIANRSANTTQANHERYQATLYANGAAEDIRNKYVDHITGGSVRSNFTECDPSCIDTKTNGIEYTVTSEKLSSAVVNTAGAPAFTYEITVEWDSITGGNAGGKDTVVLLYGV